MQAVWDSKVRGFFSVILLQAFESHCVVLNIIKDTFWPFIMEADTKEKQMETKLIDFIMHEGVLPY